MSVAYIALGSNLGDKQANLQEALRLLARHLHIVQVSPWVTTAPYGVVDQPDFLNGAAELEFDGTAQELLAVLLQTEQQMGRRRLRHWGERNIDLDLLLFDQEIINDKNLVLPHPDMLNRLFVLEPLAAIAPNLVHPTAGKTIKVLLEELRKDADS